MAIVIRPSALARIGLISFKLSLFMRKTLCTSLIKQRKYALCSPQSCSGWKRSKGSLTHCWLRLPQRAYRQCDFHFHCQKAHWHWLSAMSYGSLVPALRTHSQISLNTILYFITFVATLFSLCNQRKVVPDKTLSWYLLLCNRIRGGRSPNINVQETSFSKVGSPTLPPNLLKSSRTSGNTFVRPSVGTKNQDKL